MDALTFRTDTEDEGAPTLSAYAAVAPMNGWSVPLVTAEQVRRYVAAVIHNERGNGEWTGTVVADDDTLRICRGRDLTDDDDLLPRVLIGTRRARTESGEPLYRWEGWCFRPASDWS